jgi:ferric-dicitrate binding protein FerR (iron transport regulator)
MTAPDPDDSRELAVLCDLARTAVTPPSAAELERGLAALHARRGARKSRRFGARWQLAAVVAGALVLLGVVVRMGLSGTTEHPVAVSRIDGGTLLEGGYLSESSRTGITLHFNEGSTFVLAPGTRGRLRAVTPDGARLGVEQGTASFQITHDPEHQWSVEAGPFVVTVKGTDFTVFWDPADERFELSLRRGRVLVSGPVVGENLVLRPGQKLAVSLPKAETVITEERPDRANAAAAASSEPVAPVASATGPSEQPEPPSRTGAEPSATVAGAPSARAWREALATGQWDRILADAERGGVDTALQTASSDDLLALADAARYRRRPDLARAALLAQRRRFPDSPRSLDATFLLGRVEELRSSGRPRAITWYDEYLRRAPAGTYAAEALGRKLTLTNELQGAASARRVAEEYLRRFPEGSYAGAARTLLSGP